MNIQDTDTNVAKFIDDLDAKEVSILNMLMEKRISLLVTKSNLFNQDEIEYITSLINNYNYEDKRSLNTSLVIILKSTRLCNLRCVYCNSWKEGKNQNMTFNVLAKSIFESINQTGAQNIEFVWHGGEPLLLPVNYYEKALELQNIFKSENQKISNAIQTNGTRITDEWLNFLVKNNIDIGVSLDGTKKINDIQRVYKNGKSSYQDVIDNLKICEEKNLNYGVLVVIDKPTIQEGADKLLEMITSLHTSSVGLLNVIPKNETSNICDEHYVFHSDYIDFLSKLYPLWNENYRDLFNIRDFTGLEKGIKHKKAFMCYYGGNCHLQYLTIEPNGDVSACDKYIGNKDYQYGNLMVDSLKEILINSKNAKLITQKYEQENKKFINCEWFGVCQGNCAHDNLLNNKYQQAEKNSCCGMKPLLNEIKKGSINN
jgi:uncharacterized protein